MFKTEPSAAAAVAGAWDAGGATGEAVGGGFLSSSGPFGLIGANVGCVDGGCVDGGAVVCVCVRVGFNGKND